MSDSSKQFPYQQKKEHELNRKQFGIACCVGVLAGGAAQILGHSDFIHDKVHPPAASSTPAGLVSDFKPGDSKVIKISPGNHPVLIICTGPGTFKAFSQKCTHLLCPVHYSKDRDSIICPCHKGVFSAEDGRPLAGPPELPLPEYSVAVKDGQVFVIPAQINGGGH